MSGEELRFCRKSVRRTGASLKRHFTNAKAKCVLQTRVLCEPNALPLKTFVQRIVTLDRPVKWMLKKLAR